MLLQKRKHTPDRGTAALKSALRVSAAAACIGIMSSSAASAGTIVEEWNFTLDNAFISWTQSGEVGGPGTDFGDVEGDNENTYLGPPMGPGDPFAHPDTPSLLRWGIPAGGAAQIPANQSSIEVGLSNGHFDSTTDGTMTSIKTDIPASFSPPATMAQSGNVVPTVMISHNNRTIDDSSAVLDTAVLLDVLRLTPIAPMGAAPGPHIVDPLAIEIRFAETPNSPNNSSGETGMACADMTSPDGGGCNDIFVLDVPLAAFDPMDGSLNQEFVFDEFKYNAKIGLEFAGMMMDGLRMLTDKECKAALGDDFTVDMNPFNNCIGLTTVEGMDNDFQAFLSIQLIGAVPEPGAVAIFGLGLAGLGFMRRRRKV